MSYFHTNITWYNGEVREIAVHSIPEDSKSVHCLFGNNFSYTPHLLNNSLGMCGYRVYPYGFHTLTNNIACD